jgi:hypothetical protein
MHTINPSGLSSTFIGVTIEEQSGRQTGKRNQVSDIRRAADIVTRRKGNADDVFSMVARKQLHAKDGVPSMALEGADYLMRGAGYETDKGL